MNPPNPPLKKLTLTTIGLWFIIVGLIFAFENIVIFFNPTDYPLSAPLFLVVTIVLGMGLIIYYLLERKKGKVPFNWVLLGVLILFFLYTALVIISTPTSQEITYINADGVRSFDTYTLGFGTRMKYIGMAFVAIVVLYLLIFLAPRQSRSAKLATPFFYLLMAFCVVAIGYSLITEFPVLIRFFSEGPNDYINVVKSFAVNRNTFAEFLLIGVLAAVYLNVFKPRIFHHFFLWIFAAYSIFTQSKTVIALISLVLLFFYVYKLVQLIKYRRKAGLITMTSVLAVLAVSLAVSLSLYFSVDTIRIRVNALFEEYVIGAIDTTLSARFSYIREASLSLLNGAYLVFGRGAGIFQDMLRIRTNLTNVPGVVGVYAAHNGYLEILGRYGIIGLVGYAALLGYMVYIMTKMAKKQPKYMMMSLVCLMVYIIHGIVESTYFFEPTFKGTMITLVTFGPLLIEYYRGKEPAGEVKEKLIELPRSSVLKRANNIFTFFVILFGVLAITYIGLSRANLFDTLSLTIVFGIIILTMFFLTFYLIALNFSAKPRYLSRKIIISAILVNLGVLAFSMIMIAVSLPIVAYIVFGLLLVLDLLLAVFLLIKLPEYRQVILRVLRFNYLAFLLAFVPSIFVIVFLPMIGVSNIVFVAALYLAAFGFVNTILESREPLRNEYSGTFLYLEKTINRLLEKEQ